MSIDKNHVARFAAILIVAVYAGALHAVEITVDTTLDVEADSAESYEIVGGATLTLNVASGGTYALSGVISGSGALRKEGAGELQLSNSANSISGGIYINEGSLRATASHAFGTSVITNKGPAKLIFDAQDGNFPNSIWMTGTNENASNPDLGPVQFCKDMVLQGDIGAEKTTLMQLANARTSSSINTAKGPKVVINGKVTVPQQFYMNCYGTITFNGAFNDSNNIWWAFFGRLYPAAGTVEFASPENVWPKSGIQIYSETVSCLADNVISNAVLYWEYAVFGVNGYGEYVSKVKLNGHSQRIRALSAAAYSSSAGAANGYMITSSEPATLTIMGHSSDAITGCRIQDEITVVLDSKAYPNFMQTIKDRTCPTTGDLIVSNGRFCLTGTASFPNVPNIYVGEGGVLTNASTAALAFAGCRNLTVLGTLTCTGDATPFGGNLNLTLGTDASFSLPAGATAMVVSLKVGDTDMPEGTYGDGGTPLAQIKQGTVIVRSCDRYVDCVNGSDLNDGAYGRPYKTIRAATTNAVSGDIIHVAPGTYGAEEGSQKWPDETSEIGTRVVIPDGVTLVSTEGAEKTFIVGAASPDPAVTEGWQAGIGPGAVRCVRAGDGAVLRGFTLTGGYTQASTAALSNDRYASAFYSSSRKATIEDCIVSNNVASRYTIYEAVVKRCLVVGNTAAASGGADTRCGAAGSSCAWYNSVFAKNRGTPTLFTAVVVENCTFGSGNVYDDAGHSSQVVYWDDGKDHAIFNSAILAGRYYSTNPGKICFTNCLVMAENTNSNIAVERSCNTIFTNSAAAQVDSEYRPILCGFVGIDKGDAAFSTAALGDTDILGTPRVLNGAIDIGAVEYDWRPTFSGELGRHFAVEYASPSVTTNAEGGIRMAGGEVAGSVRKTGPYDLSFTLAGGSLAAYVGGVLAGESSEPGEQKLRIAVSDAADEVRFVFTPDAESPGAVVLKQLASGYGVLLIYR